MSSLRARRLLAACAAPSPLARDFKQPESLRFVTRPPVGATVEEALPTVEEALPSGEIA